MPGLHPVTPTETYVGTEPGTFVVVEEGGGEPVFVEEIYGVAARTATETYYVPEWGQGMFLTEDNEPLLIQMPHGVAAVSPTETYYVDEENVGMLFDDEGRPLLNETLYGLEPKEPDIF